MVCRSWGIAAFGLVALAVGCVEVPDTVRAHFAGPGPNDRTNYRPGNHGAEPPPVAPVAKASTTTTTAADAADASVEPATDAGAP
jgi:hypothetical protein